MLRILVAAFALLLAATAAHRSLAAEKNKGIKVSKQLQAAAESNNRFAFDLYGRVRKDAGNLFRADHPFVFLIRETRSGSILFMGRVTNPKG